MTGVDIRPFEHGDRDWVVERHRFLYERDDGFNASFGVTVGEIVDAFLAEHDGNCEAGWIACNGTERLGSVFCVKHDATTAKLRLFLLEPEARGQGLGWRLLKTCMEFAHRCGYKGMRLWTHESHRAACALYERNGWSLVSSKPVRSYGKDLVEQNWSYRF